MHHLHHRVDVAEATVHIRCPQCTRKLGREIYHWYQWSELEDAARRGDDVFWVDLDTRDT